MKITVSHHMSVGNTATVITTIEHVTDDPLLHTEENVAKITETLRRAITKYIKALPETPGLASVEDDPNAVRLGGFSNESVAANFGRLG